MTKKKSGGSVQLGTILALIIMCVFLAIANKNFYSYNNVMGILKQTAFNAFLAVGMLLCLITAGIDLSVGANAVFCACVMGAMNKAGMSGAADDRGLHPRRRRRGLCQRRCSPACICLIPSFLPLV